MEKPQTWFANCLSKNTLNWQVTDVFLFFVYLLNFNIIKIKANTIIVSAIKPNSSKFIIYVKTNSIICITSYLVTYHYGKRGKPHLLILISYGKYFTIQIIICRHGILKI